MTTNESDSSNRDDGENVSTGPVTREELYALVWSEPMLKVAERFDVSSSYMARVCTSLNVPRPERGYWAKLAVGKNSPIPPLPDARPGDELVWSRDGQPVKVYRPAPRPPSVPVERPPASSISKSRRHPLIYEAKAHFEAGRVSRSGGNYLKPHKKLLVDLAVSKTGLDRALLFANRLFLAFEQHGYRVVCGYCPLQRTI